MLKLYSFYADCGRSGSIKGLFVADEQEVTNAIGKYMYFGEILGKHSEVEGELEESEITVVSDDQEKIEWLVGLLGYSVSGYNPLDYIEDCGEEEE